VSAVLRLPTELVVASRQDVRYQVLEALGAGRRTVVLDASGTAYVDSSGIGMLLGLHRTARERGARLVIAGASDQLRALFALANVSGTLELAADLGAARGPAVDEVTHA
jgi:anti-sigma B factor antagonist